MLFSFSNLPATQWVYNHHWQHRAEGDSWRAPVIHPTLQDALDPLTHLPQLTRDAVAQQLEALPAPPPVAKDIAIKNVNRMKIAVHWVHPETNEHVYMFDVEPKAEQRVQTYNFHTFASTIHDVVVNQEMVLEDTVLLKL